MLSPVETNNEPEHEMNSSKIVKMEDAAREAFDKKVFAGNVVQAEEINGHVVEVTVCERYHNAAQRLMVNTSWKLDGKRMAFAKVCAAVGE
jgi:hypothetical protein